jgi:MFS family permease
MEAMARGPRGGGPGAGDAQSLLQVHKTFSALKIPAYRLLWLSMLASFAGMQMQMVARGVLAYDIGGTASAIAIVSLGWGLPMLLFSLVGGTVADRVEKRMLMVLSQLATASIAVGVAILVHTGYIQLWHLFASGVIQGTVFAFSGPARQAFIPEVVGEKELLNAIALNSAGMNLTRIGSPSVAGALIAVSWFNVQGVFYLQGAMNVFALILILMIPRAMARSAEAEGAPMGVAGAGWNGQQRERKPMIADLVDGLRYVIGSPILLTLMAMALVPTLIGMSYQSFLPIFARDVFGDGVDRNAEGLGFMMTITGIGALVGSLIVASMQDYPKRAQLQLAGGLMFGLSLAFFAVQGNFAIAIVALVMVGFSSAYFQALNSTMVMTASDPGYYGRVMSVYMMTFSLMPLGTLPVGLIADLIGSVSVGPLHLIGMQATQFGAGVVLFAFILLVTVVNPAYRRLEQDDFKRFAEMATERLSEGAEGTAWERIRSSIKQERGSRVAGRISTEKLAGNGTPGTPPRTPTEFAKPNPGESD